MMNILNKTTFQFQRGCNHLQSNALAGNRTLVSRVAGENSTTEPPMRVYISHCCWDERIHTAGPNKIAIISLFYRNVNVRKVSITKIQNLGLLHKANWSQFKSFQVFKSLFDFIRRISFVRLRQTNATVKFLVVRIIMKSACTIN